MNWVLATKACLRFTLVSLLLLSSHHIFAQGLGEDKFDVQMRPKRTAKYAAFMRTIHDEIGEYIQLRPEVGKLRMKILKEALGEANTTSCRKEQKAVVKAELWQDVKKVLAKGNPLKGIKGIHLESRDALPSEGVNSTLTFYGKPVRFFNDGIDTKFIMRARFYSNVKKDQSGNTIATRSPSTLNDGWLEIKLRNPSKEEMYGVNKYRVKLQDQDILAIFQADLEAKTKEELRHKFSAFSHKIHEIKQRAKNAPENNPKEVDALLDLVLYTALEDANFVKPQMVVTYERTAFKHTENPYIINGSHSDLTTHQSYEKPVEYQITVDQNIVLHEPELAPHAKSLDLEKYYHPDSNLLLGKYPEGAVVVEVKRPFPIANHEDEEMSLEHSFLKEATLDRIYDEHLEGSTPNSGKAGEFRKQITQTYEEVIAKKKKKKKSY